MTPELSRVERSYVRGNLSAEGSPARLGEQTHPDLRHDVDSRVCLAITHCILHNAHAMCVSTYAVALLLRIVDRSDTAAPLHARASRPMTVAERCNAPTRVHHVVVGQGSLAALSGERSLAAS